MQKINSTTMVVSEDPTFPRDFEKIVHSLDGLGLEVCASVEEAHTSFQALQNKIVLVVVHVTNRRKEKRLLEFLRGGPAHDPNCVVLVLTEDYDPDQAFQFLQAGAAEYFRMTDELTTIANLVDLLTSIQRHEEAGRIPRKSYPKKSPLAPDQTTFSISLLNMMEPLQRIIPQSTTVLLEGETGTGKTRLARLIHECSPRRAEPFMVIDCSSLSENLIESEMFGHVRGAFTGADRDHKGKFGAVGKGTLFLDEINSLPMHLQSKLLRVIDERMFEPVGSTESVSMDARIVAATNATSLEDEVARNNFRADLYYRLNVVGFYLPPLREHRDSVIPLALKFLTLFVRQNQRKIQRIAPNVLRTLTEYHWPGNIRELRNTMERAVALAPGPEIQLSDLPPRLVSPKTARTPRPEILISARQEPREATIAETKEEAEIARIIQALEKHNNNRLRAAKELGISRMGLYKKLHKYGLMTPN
ncbi:MAG: sigma-54 interaction domain-containing protein [Gemmataceae bacterium]